MKTSVANLIILLLAVIAAPVFSASAFDEFKSHKAGQWDFEVDFKYFNATANYSRGGGEYNSLADGHEYSVMDLDFGTRWTPTNRWGFFAQGRYSYASSQDTLSSRNNGGLSQVKVGIDYYLAKYNYFDLIPEFTAVIPFERVNTTDDKVLIGEGAMEFSGKLIAKGQLSFLEPMAFIGLTYRDEGRSALLPYGVGAEIPFTSLTLGGEIRGYQSITDDDATDAPTTKENVRFRNGGALRFYSVNPSLTETNFWLKFKATSQLLVKLGGGTTITGASTAAGWNIFSTLTYSLPDGFSFGSSEPKTVSEPATQFKEETQDGVDQNLFRLPPPPVPPPPKPKPKPNPEAQKKKLQKELDQTEMTIELRNNKKKRKDP